MGCFQWLVSISTDANINTEIWGWFGYSGFWLPIKGSILAISLSTQDVDGDVPFGLTWNNISGDGFIMYIHGHNAGSNWNIGGHVLSV